MRTPPPLKRHPLLWYLLLVLVIALMYIVLVLGDHDHVDLTAVADAQDFISIAPVQ